jgi:hypothetical protein
MGFKEFFRMMEDLSWKPLGMVIPTPPAGVIPTQWSGSDTGDSPLRSGGYMGTNQVNTQFDLMLPTVSKTGIIAQVLNDTDSRKPVIIQLGDNTILRIPHEVYRKIKVTPEKNKTLSVVFQRRTDDTSIQHSDIKSIQCF